METISVKALANKVLERNQQGNQMETEAINDGNFGGEKGGESFHGCFDPDGRLADLFLQGRAERWSDETLLKKTEDMIHDGALSEPWGFKVKDSPVIGDWWVLSGREARERIPKGAVSFAIEELRPIAEVSRVFPRAKVVEVVRANLRKAYG